MRHNLYNGMNGIKFSKYHGAGNDFVIIDARNGLTNLDRSTVNQICNRRTGVGADGLMTLEQDSAGSDFYMRYWNADGGESTMCGNGGRCISLFAHHLGIGGTVKHFNSSDGPHSALIIDANSRKAEVELGMVEVTEIEQYDEHSFFTFTGSPHYVEFVEDVAAVDVVGRGREIRHDRRFISIGGANVNFVQIIAPGHIRVRTYERGVEDETAACGTGATACALITSWAQQPLMREYLVDVEGGKLRVKFEKKTDKYDKIQLSGPAEKVFEGIFL